MWKKIAGVLGALLFTAVLVAAYNATRHLVFWGPSEAVQFANGSVDLAGTLVKPGGPGPFPAVVMLHGSGPEPRLDLPNRAVVNALLRHGFAVLAYDKRGAGESGGDFESAGYRDFINDALASVDYLTSRPDIDANRLGLYTVSESGWLGPEIASRRSSIRFLFNKVAPVTPVLETVTWEVRNDVIAAGVSEADAERISEFAAKRWRYYIAAARNPELASGPEREALERELAELRREIGPTPDVLPEQIWPYDATEYTAFAADRSYDPLPYLTRLDIPAFYAYGSADINVPTAACVRILEELAGRPGADITVRVYPGLGHSLATWAGLFHAGFPPDYLETLGSWAASRIADADGAPQLPLTP